jgi:hypothetical protein
MLGNDIAEYAQIGQGVLFEGVLAAQPEGAQAVKATFYKNREKWDKYIDLWRPKDLALKAMIDSAVRLGVATDVYTFIDNDAVNAIDRWLQKKGISVSVMHYQSIDELAYDLRFQRSIKTIYVETQEQGSIIGIRSHVVNPAKAWIA